ncbi:mannitol operon transcriptional antiterminator [Alkalihalophilus pseudofirmus OF4]|uniref:Mannitol operon transcriptional antiterminator n=1 Tax=Alkalihalophilus pseudofirmus (strain ATCC BAA-2126 / JCM 17055 / OF4) TaxID=398511 RepID=D3FQ07_ALKPO|nr:BglG family transcription antiterminator [Alkalihalophilus pseudofirmus]ADC51300.1 mannitol operon transcriptional antiterminator [Alkalihalophilus pseudofirmus OF4]
MALDQRSTQLLQLLLKKEAPVSILELSKSLRVSRRTIYYNLEKVNDWLKDNKLDQVQQVKSVGIFITTSTKKKIPELLKLNSDIQYEYTAHERQKLILILLFTSHEPIYVKDLITVTKASRNSCLNDLKAIKQQSKQYRLEINYERSSGYYIHGPEFELRKWFVNAFTFQKDNDFSTELMSLWKEANPSLLETVEHNVQLLQVLQNDLDVQLNPESIEELTWHIAFFLERMKLGEYVFLTKDEKQALENNRAYKGAELLSQELFNSNQLSVPEDEIYYLTIFLLSLRSLSDSPMSTVNGLEDVVRKMVIDFQRYACIEFEHFRAVEENLLIHIRPAFYRLKYGISAKNPLTKSIKEKYGDVFELTKKVLPHLERFVGAAINDDEAAYITMHFGGWMRKEGSQPAARKHALIVCSSGIGTSQILKSQLETLFSTLDFEVVTSIEESKTKADLIFTTVSLQKQMLPTFHVNAILNDVEKERLLTNVNRLLHQKESSSRTGQLNEILQAIEKHADIHNEKQLLEEIEYILSNKQLKIKELYKPMLNEIIDKSSIQIVDNVSSWQEAVEMASAPLLDNNSISQSYVDAMISNIVELGPYVIIAPQVAIPHARPEKGVNRLSMSLLKLNEPIAFSEEERHQASLLFVLAATDNETHLKALSQLTTMLSEEENIEKLRQSEDVTDIQVLIDKYSN